MFFHKNEDIKWYSRIFTLLLIFLLIFLVWKMLQPFLFSILMAILLSYLFYPVYLWLNKKINHETISALITLLLIIVVVLIPASFLFKSLLNQSIYLYNNYRSFLDLDKIKDFVLDQLLKIKVNGRVFDIFVNNVNKLTSNTLSLVIETTYKFIKSLPEIVFQIIMMLFFIFYFLKDGKKIVSDAFKIIPLREHYKKQIKTELNNMMSAVVFGSLVSAIIQGLVAMFIYAILGIDAYVLLGLLTIISAFVPMVGTALIWVPLSFLLFIKGIVLVNNILILKGVLLFLLGSFVISMIDNFTRPYLVGSVSKIHPLIILLGVVGGVKVMGFVGIFYGPIIFSTALLLFKISKLEWED